MKIKYAVIIKTNPLFNKILKLNFIKMKAQILITLVILFISLSSSKLITQQEIIDNFPEVIKAYYFKSNLVYSQTGDNGIFYTIFNTESTSADFNGSLSIDVVDKNTYLLNIQNSLDINIKLDFWYSGSNSAASDHITVNNIIILGFF